MGGEQYIHYRRIHSYTSSLVNWKHHACMKTMHTHKYEVFLHDVHKRCVQVDLFPDSLFNEKTELGTVYIVVDVRDRHLNNVSMHKSVPIKGLDHVILQVYT